MWSKRICLKIKRTSIFDIFLSWRKSTVDKRSYSLWEHRWLMMDNRSVLMNLYIEKEIEKLRKIQNLESMLYVWVAWKIDLERFFVHRSIIYLFENQNRCTHFLYDYHLSLLVPILLNLNEKKGMIQMIVQSIFLLTIDTIFIQIR